MPGDRKFEGTPQDFEDVHIKLTATDEATNFSVSDEFDIKIKYSVS